MSWTTWTSGLAQVRYRQPRDGYPRTRLPTGERGYRRTDIVHRRDEPTASPTFEPPVSVASKADKNLETCSRPQKRLGSEDFGVEFWRFPAVRESVLGQLSDAVSDTSRTPVLSFLRQHADAVLLQFLGRIRQGLEEVPTCFGEMLCGDNFGKMLVQVAPDPTL